jgi:hypothetical protein
MNHKEQSSADKDNPAIIYENIFAAWKAGESAKEISNKTGLKLSTVMKILKGRQKQSIQKGR